MVGSSMSIADANTVLNSIVADSLREIADELEGSIDFNDKVIKVICKIINDHKRVIFDGNGYSKECSDFISFYREYFKVIFA